MSVHNDKSLRVLLCGGLGNQLFQYAYGRALALRSGLPLQLDAVNLFNRDLRYQRNYELSSFKLFDDVRVVQHPKLFFRSEFALRRYLCCLGLSRLCCLITEKNADVYDSQQIPTVVSGGHWVHGYWQCEDYFSDYAETVRRDLEPVKDSGIAMNTALLGEGELVAIHFRRADYSNILSLNYYRRGIEFLRSRLSNLSFLVFTDEPDWWYTSDIVDNDMLLFDDTGLSPGEVLLAMASCRHFIIANSSFSWWSAWLGERADSVIVSPARRHWFNSDAPVDRWVCLNASEESSQ